MRCKVRVWPKWEHSHHVLDIALYELHQTNITTYVLQFKEVKRIKQSLLLRSPCTILPWWMRLNVINATAQGSGAVVVSSTASILIYNHGFWNGITRTLFEYYYWPFWLSLRWRSSIKTAKNLFFLKSVPCTCVVLLHYIITSIVPALLHTHEHCSIWDQYVAFKQLWR